MRHWENIHWLIAALWVAYPLAVVFGVIAKRRLDQVAPDFRKRKEP